MKRKPNWYYVKPFNASYALFPTREPLSRFLRTLDIDIPERMDDSAGAIVRPYTNGMKYFMAVELGDLTDVDEYQVMVWLVHEAVHVFQFACQHVGEEHPSAEFEAYAIQRIFNNLWNDYAVYVNAQNKKRKKGKAKNGKSK